MNSSVFTSPPTLGITHPHVCLHKEEAAHCCFDLYVLLTLSSQFDHFLNLNLNHFYLVVQFIFPTQHLYTRLAACMLRALLYQMFCCRMTEGDWFFSSPLCIPVLLHTHTNLCCLCQYVFSQTWALHLKPTFKTFISIFFYTFGTHISDYRDPDFIRNKQLSSHCLIK